MRPSVECHWLRLNILTGYFIIIVLFGGVAYILHSEWQEVEILEADNRRIDEFGKR